MAEVFELFNQTLHHGARTPRAEFPDEDEDDDERDDISTDEDQDDAEEEDMQTSAVTATPLPPMIGFRPTLLPVGSVVPATPTPAQGCISKRKPGVQKLNVFQDTLVSEPFEEAIASTSMSKLSVFSDEIEDRVDEGLMPLLRDSPNRSQSTATIFQDENAPPHHTTHRRSCGPSGGTTLGDHPLSQLNESSGLETAEGIPRTYHDPHTPLAGPRMFGHGQDEQLDPQPNERQNIDPGDACPESGVGPEEAAQYYPRRMMRFGGAFDIMTPITERTSEYTQSSQAYTLRSSTSSALAQSQRDGSANLLEEEEDLEHEVDIERQSSFSAVREECETTGKIRGTTISDATCVESTSSSPGDCIGELTGPFAVFPGHTIGSVGRGTRDVEEMQMAAVSTYGTASPGTGMPGVSGALERLCPSIDTSHTTTADRPERLLVSVQDLPSPTSASVTEFYPPNPCCPTDPQVLQPLIASLQPPLMALSGFHDMRQLESGSLDALQKLAKPHGKRASSSTAGEKGTGWPEPFAIDLDHKRFEIVDKIGEGGFGAVFKAVDVERRQLADDASDDEDDDAVMSEGSYTLAIKVERPANIWEAVVLDRLRQRLPAVHRSSIVKSRGLYCYKDESLLMLDYYNQGTLLDAVNKAQAWGIASSTAGQPGGLDETLAIFFTIELLRLLEALHGAGFIHGDLKIDNCLVRLEEADKWTSQYDMNGDFGWREKGVHIIDFGRCIDLHAYPAGTSQTFMADWPVDEKDCQEMRDGSSWSYQTDYYGLAGICYCMLFGKYISTELSPDQPTAGNCKRYQVIGSFKRVSSASCQSLVSCLTVTTTVLADGLMAIPVRPAFEPVSGRFKFFTSPRRVGGDPWAIRVLAGGELLPRRKELEESLEQT